MFAQTVHKNLCIGLFTARNFGKITRPGEWMQYRFYGQSQRRTGQEHVSPRQVWIFICKCIWVNGIPPDISQWRNTTSPQNARYTPPTFHHLWTLPVPLCPPLSIMLAMSPVMGSHKSVEGKYSDVFQMCCVQTNSCKWHICFTFTL